MRVLISGYFGFDNTGDEALLQGMLTALGATGEIRATVLSADPGRTTELHGVDAVPRDQYRLIWRILKETDLFISGGGGLLQDSTSLRSPFYYLGLIEMAKRARRPVYMYAHGVGPLSYTAVRKAAGRILPGVAGIGVRDQPSRELLVQCGVDRTLIGVTADAAFALDAPEPDVVEDVLHRSGVESGDERPLIAVVWRSCRPELGRDGQRLLTAYVAEALTRFAKTVDGDIMILSFHPRTDVSSGQDLAWAIREQDKDVVAHVPGDIPFHEQFALLSAAEVLLTVRYHGLALGCVAGVPAVSVGYHPKVTHLSEAVGAQTFLPQEVRVGHLSAALLKTWHNRRETSWNLRLLAQHLKRRALDEGKRAAAIGQESLHR